MSARRIFLFQKILLYAPRPGVHVVSGRQTSQDFGGRSPLVRATCTVGSTSAVRTRPNHQIRGARSKSDTTLKDFVTTTTGFVVSGDSESKVSSTRGSFRSHTVVVVSRGTNIDPVSETRFYDSRRKTETSTGPRTDDTPHVPSWRDPPWTGVRPVETGTADGWSTVLAEKTTLLTCPRCLKVLRRFRRGQFWRTESSTTLGHCRCTTGGPLRGVPDTMRVHKTIRSLRTRKVFV